MPIALLLRPSRPCAQLPFIHGLTSLPVCCKVGCPNMECTTLTSYLLALSAIFVSVDSCLQNLPPFQPQQGTTIELGLEGEIFAIVPAYNFTCNGKVTEWKAYVERSGSYDIEFQVWRKRNADGCYTLIGSNERCQLEAVNFTLIVPLNESEQFEFHPGDIVGFYIISESNQDASIQLDTAYSSVSVLYTDDVPNTGTLCTGSDLEEPIPGAPIITAVISTISAPTPAATYSLLSSTPLSTPQPSGEHHPDNTITGVLIGAIVGAFCVGVIIVLVAIPILLYVWRTLNPKRNPANMELTESRIYTEPTHSVVNPSAEAMGDEDSMIDNDAYLEYKYGTDLEVKDNPAYELSGTAFNLAADNGYELVGPVVLQLPSTDTRKEQSEADGDSAYEAIPL